MGEKTTLAMADLGGKSDVFLMGFMLLKVIGS